MTDAKHKFRKWSTAHPGTFLKKDQATKENNATDEFTNEEKVHSTECKSVITDAKPKVQKWAPVHPGTFLKKDQATKENNATDEFTNEEKVHSTECKSVMTDAKPKFQKWATVHPGTSLKKDQATKEKNATYECTNEEKGSSLHNKKNEGATPSINNTSSSSGSRKKCIKTWENLLPKVDLSEGALKKYFIKDSLAVLEGHKRKEQFISPYVFLAGGKYHKFARGISWLTDDDKAD